MFKLIFCNRICVSLTIPCLVLIGFLNFPSLSGATDFDFFDIGNSTRFNLGSKDNLTALTFKNQSSLTPYIGAGIGELGQGDKDQANLADQFSEKALEDLEYKVGVGMDYSLKKNTGLTLGYKWNTGSTSELLEGGIGNLSPDQENQHISVGIKVGF